jgi:hypothetical protein
MNAQLVEDCASAILYEGYRLYPPKAIVPLNRQRFNFGVVVPREAPVGAGTSELEAQCLVYTSEAATLDVRVRFLLLTRRQVDEVIERVVSVQASIARAGRPVWRPFSWPALDTDGRATHAVAGVVEVCAERVAPHGLFKITVRVMNTTPLRVGVSLTRAELLEQSFVSTHALIHVPGGDFLSLVDPPQGIERLAAECRSSGLWPVLVGESDARDAMLASPIILYDYPRVAPDGVDFGGSNLDRAYVVMPRAASRPR